MSSWVIALVVRPFMVFVLLVLVMAIKMAINHWLPDSALKRALFKVRGRR